MWFAPNENNLPDNRGRFSVKGLAHCVCWTPLPQFQQQKGARASGFDNFTVLSNFKKTHKNNFNMLLFFLFSVFVSSLQVKEQGERQH